MIFNFVVFDNDIDANMYCLILPLLLNDDPTTMQLLFSLFIEYHECHNQLSLVGIADVCIALGMS